jgi:hypothetical protein
MPIILFKRYIDAFHIFAHRLKGLAQFLGFTTAKKDGKNLVPHRPGFNVAFGGPS